MEGYVTRAEAAKLLDMSLSTLDRRCAEGRIAKYYFSDNIVRLSVQELYAYAESCRVIRTKDTRQTRKKNTKHRAPVNLNWKPGQKLV